MMWYETQRRTQGRNAGRRNATQGMLRSCVVLLSLYHHESMEEEKND